MARPENRAFVDGARCRGCGCCIRSCPVGALAFAGQRVQVDEDSCVGCATCVDRCPFGAIGLRAPSGGNGAA